ncbi:hypothetical protein KY310_00660 [Candidatus Woesearchaeota archaeon]|nr:hypothetical protein [Candidatus Woesearchaeota archaeon]
MIPDRDEQNKWLTSAYQKMHALDFKGLAKQVNETVNPVARKRIRQEKFNKAFQEAFDEELGKLVPELLAEIVDEQPTWLPHKALQMYLIAEQNMYNYSSSEPIPDYLSQIPKASA